MVKPECFYALDQELRVVERYEGREFELSVVTWGDSARPVCRIILDLLSCWGYGCSFPVGIGRHLSHERAPYDLLQSRRAGREGQ